MVIVVQPSTYGFPTTRTTNNVHELSLILRKDLEQLTTLTFNKISLH